MTLVAGIDSSTQSCKVVIRDAASGALVRSGRAKHPDGTEVHPRHWEDALVEALADAGGVADVDALAVGGQQHGMVCLDADGEVVRPALLWNDTRSAAAAADLVAELGASTGGDGALAWAQATGLVPVASFTVSKVRWLRDAEPDAVARSEAVCLPHDWLTWRMAGSPGLDALVTDRGDASGTGYYSAATGEYRRDLLQLAMGRDVVLPRVLGPAERAGTTGVGERRLAGLPDGLVLGPGTGDNAAAALGVGARPGDVVVSIGTSGVVTAVAEVPACDPTGTVAGFADATGRYLPLVCTLNAARVLDAAKAMLRVGFDEFDDLALSAPSGSDGLVLVPYLEGERTPNKPDSTGAFHGLRLANSTAAHLARAAVEGLLCGLADGLDALAEQGARVERVVLVGGGAKWRSVCELAPVVLGRPVVIPEPGEYVADGAARQAAWVLAGGDQPPAWEAGGAATYEGTPDPRVREQYAAARDLTVSRPA
ncbi:MAG: xylulokinase [Kineosporiaceae bacterium]